ncbi:hypothetical protein NPIL_503131 [Nephila pilipes]|uniref:Uncharacterized protein n=1 Tax=Nephila pilipes TaxID=299642 RepID=A0A8X6TZP7_NEPPI|nr:hypothetical protein NPIL_503131 [Nephila pilipes]
MNFARRSTTENLSQMGQDHLSLDKIEIVLYELERYSDLISHAQKVRSVDQRHKVKEYCVDENLFQCDFFRYIIVLLISRNINPDQIIHTLMSSSPKL